MLICGQLSCLPADGLELGFGIWEPDPGLLLPRRAPYGTHPPHTSIFHHHPSLFSPLLCRAPNGTPVERWAVLHGEVSALFHPPDFWNGPCPLPVSLKYVPVVTQ